jgi:hypothetical protein
MQKIIIFEERFLRMKCQTFLIFLLSFYTQVLFSQSCLPEGITFSTQEQIDSFQSNYPGCKVIGGFVKITGNDISNLLGLNELDSILGRFVIDYMFDLQDLVGLEDLKFIGGDFTIEDAPSLHDLTGLESLSAVGGNLEITWNDWLFSLDGLQSLTTVDGSVLIDANWELTSLVGLNNLVSIGGSLVIGNWWSGNEVLSNLDGLNSLTTIGEGVFIGFNNDLTSLDGLNNLNSLVGELSIVNNPNLTSLSGLENITDSVLTHVWIYDNPSLTECNIQSLCEYLADIPDMIGIYNNGPGCDNPHEIADSCGFDLSCLPFGNYYFVSQADVDSFPSYYPDCNRLEGRTYIEGADITRLDSLYGIDTINGLFSICGNPLLTSLSGLDNLRSVNGNLHLGYWEKGSNPLLTDMAGLGDLHYVGGELLLLGNTSLQNFNGLDSLEEIGLWFSIIENLSLKSFEGLNSLHTVGEIGISGNDSLSSLNGLQGLENVTFTVAVKNNPMLYSLDGIENINADSMLFLRIQNNDTLSECSVKTVCDLLGIPEANVIIEENAPGCNSPEEVELACSLGVGESAVSSQQSAACPEGTARRINCYPNPAFSEVVFDFNLETQSKVNLSVFNNTGQLAATILDGSLEKGKHQVIWNASALTAGIYFYRLTESSYSATGKLMVVK